MKTLEEMDLASLRLVKYPDPALQELCAEVEEFGEPLKGLAKRMLAIMYAARGVGLAAPQVGVPIRLFAFSRTGQPGPDAGACVNPRIVDATGQAVQEEGCLSLPGITCRTKRFSRIVISGQDLEGRPLELVGEALLARIFQHEVDHLNGILLTNRMSSVSKLANRRLLKELEEQYRNSQTA